MTPRSELPPDAGVSVLILAPAFPGRERFLSVWQAQLAQLSRPVEIKLLEGDKFGAALREAFSTSAQPLVLILTPDFSYRPNDVNRLLEAIREVDVVLAVHSGIPRPIWLRRWLTIQRWLCRIIFGIDTGEPAAWFGWSAAWTRWQRRLWYGMRVQDAEGGLRLLRREMLDRCPIQSDGRFALVEMIAKINFVGGLIVEIPLERKSDLPMMPAPFHDVPSDERTVFRQPRFS